MAHALWEPRDGVSCCKGEGLCQEKSSEEEMMFELNLRGFIRVCKRYGGVSQHSICKALKIYSECYMRVV